MVIELEIKNKTVLPTRLLTVELSKSSTS